MKTNTQLLHRIIDEVSSGPIKVIIRDESHILYEIDSVQEGEVSVLGINDSMEGPLSHNEQVLILYVSRINQNAKVQ